MQIILKKRYPRTIFLSVAATLLAITAALVVFYFLQARTSNTASAAGQGGLTFQEFATHPYAVNIPGQQRIFDMEVTEEGELIAGYGDWDANIDSFGNASQRVGVVPLNLTTGSWGDIFYAGSEAIDVIRKIDGKLYIPTTDPSNKAATGNPSGNISGYVTNETGEWTFVDNGKADVHTFDIAKRTNNELWTVGNNENPAPRGAVAWRSNDAGNNWELGLDGPAGTETRYYWLAPLDDAIYTFEMFSGDGLRKFDGTQWTSSLDYSCMTYDAKKIEVFDGKIICGQGGGYFGISDGTTHSQINITGANEFTSNTAEIKDFYQTDTHLYALLESGIFRTTSLDSPWERLTFDAEVAGSESIAVYEDTVYLGKSDGTIWKAGQTISSMTPLSVQFEDCSAFDASTGTVTAYYAHSSLCPEDVVIPSTIDGVAVTTIGDGAFGGRGITSVVIPEGVTSIGNGAFGEFDAVRNAIHTVSLPSTLKNIGSWAFSGNAITTIDLPDGLETLGAGAFYSNQLAEILIPASLNTIEPSTFSFNYIASLTIPSSITSIGAMAFEYNSLKEVTVQGNPTIGENTFRFNGLDRRIIPSDIPQYQAEYLKFYEDNTEFIRIHSTNTDFLNGKTDAVYSAAQLLDYEVLGEELMTWRAIYADQYVVGGLLFNPASIVATYIDTSDNTIRTQQTLTGLAGQLAGYRVSSALERITKTATETTDDSGNEDTIFSASFTTPDPYFRVGQVVTINPVAITGYNTPTAQSVTLSGIANSATFMYLTQSQVDDGVIVNPDGTITPGAPNTGIETIGKYSLILIAGALLVMVSLVTLNKRRLTASQRR